MGIALIVLGLRRKCRHRDLAPRSGTRVRTWGAAPQLCPEMAEVERCVNRIVGIGQHGRDRIAEKLRIDHLPAAAASDDFEQTLAGRDMEPIRHSLLPQPPDSAWRT